MLSVAEVVVHIDMSAFLYWSLLGRFTLSSKLSSWISCYNTVLCIFKRTVHFPQLHKINFCILFLIQDHTWGIYCMRFGHSPSQRPSSPHVSHGWVKTQPWQWLSCLAWHYIHFTTHYKLNFSYCTEMTSSGKIKTLFHIQNIWRSYLHTHKKK